MRGFRWFAAMAACSSGLLVGWLPGGLSVQLPAWTAAAGAIVVIPSWALLGASVLVFRSFPEPRLGMLAVADVLILAWLARAYAGLMIRKYPIRTTGPMLVLLAYFVAAWALTLWAGVSITPLLRMSSYAAVALSLAATTMERRRPVMWVIVVYAVVEVLFSLPQLASRMAGVTVRDPQQLGILLIAALSAVALGDVTMRRSGRLAVLGVLWLGIAATRTRGVWLAAIVFLVVISVRHASRRKIVVVTLVLFGAAWFLYGPVTSVLDLNPTSRDYRVESVTEGIRVGLENWTTGVGWGGLSAVEADERLLKGPLSVPYNLPVLIFVYTGVVGLVLFLLFVWHAYGSVYRTSDRPVFAFLSAFLTISMLEPTFYAGSLATFLFFLYCGFGLSHPAVQGGKGPSDDGVRHGKSSPILEDRPRLVR